MTNVQTYIVGKTYRQWRGIPDGYRVNTLSRGGLQLEILMNRPTEEEERDCSQGAVECRFTPVSTALGFWCFRFGGQPWADAPYSPSILPSKPDIPEILDGTGLSVVARLIDTQTGQLRNQRFFSLGTQVSRYFRDWCQEAPGHMGIESYNLAIDTASGAFTSEDLAENTPAYSRWTVPGRTR